MESRGYVEGDEKKIEGLFEAVFGRPIEKAAWEWRFLKSPFGRSIIRLMFDDQDLVGHYAVTPIPLWVGNHVIDAAFSLTTMTHPAYKRKGIFTRLAKEVYEICREEGKSLVFGFPNANSYYGFTERLGWKGFGLVEGWRTALKGEEGNHKMELEPQKALGFDGAYDLLWESARPWGKVMVPRSAEYLNWRFFGKPGGEYEVYGFFDQEGVLCGYTVLKVYLQNGERIGHIIDSFFLPEGGMQAQGIMNALHHFHELGINNVSCWSNSPETREELHKAGFRREQWPTYFGMRNILQSSDDVPASDLTRWEFSMGDSDVF